jgi:ABC-type multidrug transport system fused ATPase/permease subunit
MLTLLNDPFAASVAHSRIDAWPLQAFGVGERLLTLLNAPPPPPRAAALTWPLLITLLEPNCGRSYLLQAVGAGERVLTLLNDPPAPQLSPGLVPASFSGRFELRGVGFRYPGPRSETPALQEVDLLLQPGRLVALVGAHIIAIRSLDSPFAVPIMLKAHHATGRLLGCSHKCLLVLKPMRRIISSVRMTVHG